MVGFYYLLLDKVLLGKFKQVEKYREKYNNLCLSPRVSSKQFHNL
jgi:hypothetical protein